MVFSLLIANKFSRPAKSTSKLRTHDSLLHFRRRIRSYYLTIPGHRLLGVSRIDQISLKMFMPDQKKSKRVPRLTAKAAESRWLVPLLPILCLESYSFLGPRKDQLFKA
eukprot:4504802-Pyramimonas_sp.AAC.1